MQQAQSSSSAPPSSASTHTLTSSSSSKGTLSWKINNFTAVGKKNGEWMESLPVATGKYNWVLRLFPAGINEDNKTYVSCYLRVSDMSAAVSDELSVKFVLYAYVNGDTEPLVRLKTNQRYDKKHLDWGYPQCISLEVLKRALESSKDDSLQFECEFEVFHDWKTTEMHGDSDPKKIPIPASTIGTDLYKLLSMNSDESFSDVTFVVNSTKFTAHKNILSARCKVFSTMFKSGMLESSRGGIEIDIEDTDERTFKEMLHFIYTGECDNVVLQEKVVDLLALADRYDLPCLKLMCEDVMLQRLTGENAGETLAFADTFHSFQLKKCIMEYIVENFFQVIATEGFKNLCIKMPLLVAEVHDAVAANAGTKKTLGTEKGKKTLPAKRKR